MIATANEQHPDLEVRQGDAFQVELQSIPSSGAIWYLDQCDEGVQLEDEVRAPASEGLGGAVRQSFRFTCLNPGVFALHFVMKRAWEAETRRSLRVTVTTV